MSRFLRPPEPAGAPPTRIGRAAAHGCPHGHARRSNCPMCKGTPRPGQSVYETRRYERTPEPVTIAETNAHTGELEWLPDWGRRVTGWKPLGEFLRDRGVW